MTSVFDQYGRVYDLIYRDKNYTLEAEYVAKLLQNYGNGCNLLEFGCGTGHHARLLAERGYKVMGIERSAEMIAKATQGNGFDCIQGDICDVHMGKTYDAVLSLFHVFSYQTSNASACAVFERAAEHLRVGGVFIFDIWYSPAVYCQRASPRVKRFTDGQLELIRIAEPEAYPNENRVDVHYTILVKDSNREMVQEISEIHSMRHFSLPELDLMADNSGFERVATEEFLSGRMPSEKTWSVCIVMRKK